ncbi:MAG: prolipoprotein diacylglyceryl transferase [Acidobacteria bacterium]|nr:prolipoprotein diacylglyceryl transferase [Acidobacteriota bacterium]
MFPRLFTFEPYFTLHTYGVLMAAALFAGLYTAVRLAPRAGLAREFVWNTGIYMALAGLVGGKLLLIASEWRYYLENPKQIFSWSTVQAAGFFHGGLLLAMAVAAYCVWRERVSYFDLCDVCAPGIAIGLVLARLGCFTAGCCWGKPAQVAWAVTFTDPYAARFVGVPLGIALHPAQLYESALSALVFVWLLSLWRRRRFPGQVFAAFLLAYSTLRFVLEYFRDDPRGPFFFDGALSTPQLVSLGLFVAGLAIWWRQRRLPLSAADARQAG